MTDKTTDGTTIHLTNPAKGAGQIIGYSHSTRLPKNGNPLAGYKSKLLAARLLAILLAGFAFSLPVAAKLYKWVDDKGITHYGETVPPEHADKNRAEMNKAGRVIKKDGPLTPEERRAKELADAQKLEDEKAALVQQRRDQTITDTYSNSKEVDLARNRSLQQVDARITSMESQLKMVGGNLLGLQNEANGYTKANKAVPASLQEDLEQTQARLDKMQQTMEQLKAERASVNARYDADKARYLELTGKH